MTRLLLVRPGETPESKDEIVQGQTETELTERGKQEATALRDTVDNLDVDLAAVHTSDLPRATRTAELAFPDYDVNQSVALREQDFGDAVGQTMAAFTTKNPEYELTTPNGVLNRFPNGESTLDVYGRVTFELRRIRDSLDPEETAVVILHSTPLLAVLSMVWDEDTHRVMQTTEIDTCEVIDVEATETGIYHLRDRHETVVGGE